MVMKSWQHDGSHHPKPYQHVILLASKIPRYLKIQPAVIATAVMWQTFDEY